MSLSGGLKVQSTKQQIHLHLEGVWRLTTLMTEHQTLQHYFQQSQPIIIDFSNIKVLDTAVFSYLIALKQARQASVTFFHLPKRLQDQAKALKAAEGDSKPDNDYNIEAFLQKLGYMSLVWVSYIGAIAVRLMQTFSSLGKRDLQAILYHLEQVGPKAVVIIFTISFMIGMVLIYQGAYQLRQFGAEIYAVNLLAISTVREIGILLTAIVMAGRSGSAFAANIAMMRLNQEIEAMQVMGLETLRSLVIPRLLALLISLPLLGMVAILAALGGGGLVAVISIELTWTQFLIQLQLAVNNWSLAVGFIKAPFFAIIITLIGCFHGLQAHGGAVAVGRAATLAVVQGIFWVIIADALFSLLFTYIGI